MLASRSPESLCTGALAKVISGFREIEARAPVRSRPEGDNDSQWWLQLMLFLMVLAKGLVGSSWLF